MNSYKTPQNTWPEQSKDLFATAHLLVIDMKNNILHFALDFAQSKGLSLEQLLSPDCLIISDLEILSGINLPELRLLSAFLIELDEIEKALSNAYSARYAANSAFVKENVVIYSSLKTFLGSTYILKECIQYMDEKGVQLFVICKTLAEPDGSLLKLLGKSIYQTINELGPYLNLNYE